MTPNTLAFLGNMSIGEIFGAKRIPELARSLGRASREYKDARDGIITELEKEPATRKKDEDTEQEKGKED